MKKLLLSVIAFALILTSCYKKDFKNLNTRLDAQAAQLTALATQVQGVATLVANISAIQTTLGQLQTAIATINTNTSGLQAGLTSLTGTVGTIKTNLDALAAAVSTGPTSVIGLLGAIQTQATTNVNNLTTLVNQVKSDLQTAITNGNTALAATIQIKLDALQLALTTAITDAKNALLLSNTSQTADIILAYTNALNAAMLVVNTKLDLLLANQNIYDNDLTITNEAELVFAEGLLNRVNIVKGNVEIDNSSFSAGQNTRLNVVAARMYSILYNFDYTGVGTNFTNLSSIGQSADIHVTGSIGLPALTTVGDWYEVVGSDIADGALTTIGDGFYFNYDGPYSSTSLTSVGGDMEFVVIAPGGGNVGTTSVNFPNLTTAGDIWTSTGGWGSAIFPEATSVNLGAGELYNLTAAKAVTVRLGEAVYSADLTVSAVLATSIDLSAMTNTSGAINITGKAGSTVNLANYADNDDITITGPVTQDIPKVTSSILTSTTIKTITLAKHRAAETFAGLSILENITLGAAENPITGLANSLKTINATGAAYTASLFLDVTAGNKVNLTTVTVGGQMVFVTILGDGASDKVASVTTSGVINSFTLVGTKILTGVTLGHSHKVGGTGSELYIQNNVALTALTSSTDFASVISISGNAVLASINLASYVNPILGGVVNVTIDNNKLSGVYTPAVEGTATTAFVMTKIQSADLMTLKAYLQQLDLAGGASVVYQLGIDDVNPGLSVQTVDDALDNDYWLINPSPVTGPPYQWAGSTANVNNSDINIAFELNLVQN
jgi:hypothetical protein